MTHLRTNGLAAVAILAVGAVVSGCGGTTKAVRLPASGPITKTNAVTYAQAVNLIPADVPGMLSVSLERESKPGRGDTEEARCAGTPSPTRVVVTIESPWFRSGSGLQVKKVQSEVSVRPSAALATRSLSADQAALRDARNRTCLLRDAAGGLATGFHRANKRISLSVGRLVLSPLPHSLPRSFAFRITMPLTFGRAGRWLHTRAYLDALGFVRGPAVVSMTAAGYSSPVPTATEQRLLSLLYGRA